MSDLSALVGHLRGLHGRWIQAAAKLEDPALMGTPAWQEVLREHARLGRVAEPFATWLDLERQALATGELLADPDLKAEALAELVTCREHQERLLEDIAGLLATSDPAANRNAILEIRAGTGGDEASLFAGDLARMYTMWCGARGLKLTPMTVAEGEKGGFKEVTFHVSGRTADGLGAFALLRFESGGHRVQRVPETESQGRIHTSAATVAVMPEAEEADVVIRPDDLEISSLRAGGAGGQHVNKTESAIRILHKPSGLMVVCSEERNQGANKTRAMTWIRSRLYEAERERLARERALFRKEQVGSGDRSDRIRTYNFPQNRITDHRINYTGYSLDRYVNGAGDELYQAMVADEKARFLATWDGTL